VELKGCEPRLGNVSVNCERVGWTYKEPEGKLVVPTEEDAGEIVVEVRI